MECPKCKTGNLKITNVYSGSDRGRFKKAQCLSCLCTVTIQELIINVDPEHGEGAYALARRTEKQNPTHPIGSDQ